MEMRLLPSELRDQLQTALSGSYTLERELGGGGMSRVFIAEETRLGRRVVVKVLSSELAAGVSAERFEREIRFAAQLQQANIVPLLSAGNAAGVPYYTMPYVEGESLRARLEGGGLPLDDCIRILSDVARALSYAHAHGVVHRDIKADNVLLSHGAAMVTDFGIAKAIVEARAETHHETLTRTGMSIGTPAYMAPEQVTGDKATDSRADIYAFGCLAYELITGQLPFHGRSMQKVFAAHITEVPTRVDAVRDGIPPWLADLVAQCLAKEPAQRPESGDEILRALSSSRSGDTVAPVAAAPTGTTHARRRTRTGVMIGALGTVFAGAAYAALAWRSAAPSAIDSIAVLPFESVGGDTANAYFAEGMADELSTAIGKVGGVRVAARRSSAAVRGMGLTIAQIGERLDVRGVVTGSVRRAGDRMRVTAELASVATNATLWDSTYERSVTDVFALQDELTRAIVGALRLKLANTTASSPDNSVRGTANLEAYDLYMRGMHFYNRRGASLPKAMESFHLAIAHDSSFTRAWAAMALTLTSLVAYDPAADADELAQRSEAAAQRAVTLDSTSSDAYTALGRALMLARKWRAASGAFEKAIALDPASPLAHHQFGFFLLFGSTQYRRGLDELRMAVQLDPLDVTAGGWLGLALVLDGRAEEAIQVAQKAVEIDSMIGPSQWALMYANYVAGHPGAARARAQRARLYASNFGVSAFVLARTGDVAGARGIIRTLEALPESSRSQAFLGTAYLGLGDTARALSYLESAARGSYVLQNNFGLPMFDELRGTVRFGALMRAYGLDDRILNSPRGGRP